MSRKSKQRRGELDKAMGEELGDLTRRHHEAVLKKEFLESATSKVADSIDARLPWWHRWLVKWLLRKR